MLFFSWIWSLVLSLPPLLGWGSFKPGKNFFVIWEFWKLFVWYCFIYVFPHNKLDFLKKYFCHLLKRSDNLIWNLIKKWGRCAVRRKVDMLFVGDLGLWAYCQAQVQVQGQVQVRSEVRSRRSKVQRPGPRLHIKFGLPLTTATTRALRWWGAKTFDHFHIS